MKMRSGITVIAFIVLCPSLARAQQSKPSASQLKPQSNQAKSSTGAQKFPLGFKPDSGPPPGYHEVPAPPRKLADVVNQKMSDLGAYEDADALPDNYANSVEKISTIRGKLNALARGIETLQKEIVAVGVELKNEEQAMAILNEAQSGEDSTTLKGQLEHERIITQHAEAINALSNELEHLKFQTMDVESKKEMNDFKEAACPLLRKLADWKDDINLTLACSGH